MAAAAPFVFQIRDTMTGNLLPGAAPTFESYQHVTVGGGISDFDASGISITDFGDGNYGFQPPDTAANVGQGWVIATGASPAYVCGSRPGSQVTSTCLLALKADGSLSDTPDETTVVAGDALLDGSGSTTVQWSVDSGNGHLYFFISEDPAVAAIGAEFTVTSTDPDVLFQPDNKNAVGAATAPFLSGGVAPTPVDPTITAVSPSGQGIGTQQKWLATLSLSTSDGTVTRILIMVEFPSSANGRFTSEEAYIDGAFTPDYSGASTLIESSPGVFDIVLIRNGGWPSSPRIRVHANTDRGGMTE